MTQIQPIFWYLLLTVHFVAQQLMVLVPQQQQESPERYVVDEEHGIEGEGSGKMPKDCAPWCASGN